MSSLSARKVALETLGCKLNQAESERLAQLLVAAGWEVVGPEEPADVYILNTCTVTHIADRKARQLLRAAAKRFPDARIIAAGCYAERAAEELSRIPGVSLVLGHTAKDRLTEILGSPEVMIPLDRKTSPMGRTRSFVKVQSGCRHGCSYCIVPKVRGAEVSLSPLEVLEIIKDRLGAGYREIVLTGTRVGIYRHGDTDLQGLIRLILKDTSVERLRLSSLQPREITPELIRLWDNPRLCRHFHLALQSGSPTVLLRMNREYTIFEYEATVALIRSQVPETALTTDVIVGFPGETETEFQESYENCRRMAFARIHVFPYSARPGTAAAALPGKIDSLTLKGRTQQMLCLAAGSSREFRCRFLGQTLPVLWEQYERNGDWSGLTDNYLRVYTRTPVDLANTICNTRLIEVFHDGLRGEVSSPPPST
jgi:threonylcarbamoyladenosine tRNA methylthiotransferase MtaB